MRKFRIFYGKLKGEYPIYDGIQDATDNLPKNTVIKRWGDPTIDTGDWVESDDGFVIQCIEKLSLVDKQKSHYGRTRDFYRFPMCSNYGYYRKKDGLYITNRLYAIHRALSPSNLATMDYSTLDAKSYNYKKQLFVALVKGGMDPFEAVSFIWKDVDVYKKNGILHRTVISLLSNEKVQKELVKEIREMDLSQALKQKIYEKTGMSLEEFIADKIAATITMDAKSVKDSIALTRLSIDIGKISSIINEKIDRKQITNASYEEVLPPKLKE